MVQKQPQAMFLKIEDVEIVTSVDNSYYKSTHFVKIYKVFWEEKTYLCLPVDSC